MSSSNKEIVIYNRMFLGNFGWYEKKIQYERYQGKRFSIEIEKRNEEVDDSQWVRVTKPRSGKAEELLVEFPLGAIVFHWRIDRVSPMSLLKSRRGIDKLARRILCLRSRITDEDIGCALYGLAYNDPEY